MGPSSWWRVGTVPLAPGRNIVQVLDGMLLGAHAESSSHSLLTVVPATVTVHLGTLAGGWLLTRQTQRRKVVGLVAGGLVAAGVGLAVAWWIPVNRRLWTPSFCLLTAGLSATACGLFYWVVEILGLRRGLRSLIAYGANPFFLFVLSGAGGTLLGMKGITDSNGTWRSLWTVAYNSVQRVADPKLASFIIAAVYTAFFGAVAVVMYRRNWIFKV